MAQDILRQSIHSQSATVALALLLFISIFEFVALTLGESYLSASAFLVSAGAQVFGLWGIQQKRVAELNCAIAIVAVWSAFLVMSISSSQTKMIWLPVILMASYFVLALRHANALNVFCLLALLISVFSALGGITSVSWGVAGLFVMLLINIAFRQANYFQRALADLQVTDSLSGCHNRKALQKELSKAVSISQRYKAPISLLTLEMANHEDLLQKEGYEGVDALIKEWVQVCKSRLRNTDMLCRYSDACFVCVLPNTLEHNALSLAEDLKRSSEAYEYRGKVCLELNAKAAQHDVNEAWDEWLKRSIGA